MLLYRRIEKCLWIAEKLRMWDDTWGEGLTADDFFESINGRYSKLYPDCEKFNGDEMEFEEVLNKVIEYYENEGTKVG